jgi:hypothetical protein
VVEGLAGMAAKVQGEPSLPALEGLVGMAERQRQRAQRGRLIVLLWNVRWRSEPQQQWVDRHSGGVFGPASLYGGDGASSGRAQRRPHPCRPRRGATLIGRGVDRLYRLSEVGAIFALDELHGGTLVSLCIGGLSQVGAVGIFAPKQLLVFFLFDTAIPLV